MVNHKIDEGKQVRNEVFNYRNIEELSMNAWPALQTVLYDGWVIRFSDGYTRRANSINPLFFSTEDIHEKIQYCEQIFEKKNLSTIFKITPDIYPSDLDNLLEAKGYRFENDTSLQMLDLSEIEEADLTEINIAEGFSENWLDDYCEINSVNNENKIILRKMLHNITTWHSFVSIQKDGQTVACGLCVLERGHLGLFDIVVHKDYRNQGYGEKLIKSIISIGKDKGAKKAYLQVFLNNTPALKLYSKVGFKEEFRYWYRVKG